MTDETLWEKLWGTLAANNQIDYDRLVKTFWDGRYGNLSTDEYGRRVKDIFIALDEVLDEQ